MAAITAGLVKELREKTGAGMMDCKKALVETDGDLELAVDWLRKKGLAAAAKKAGRVASEGLIAVQSAGTRGAIVEVNSETDFVSRNEEFQAFVKSLAEIAITTDGEIAKLLAAPYPGTDNTVEEQVTAMIARIGENMVARRSAVLRVDQGVISTYVHNQVAPGLGKIGVLVALESEGDTAKLDALGKQVAMHVCAANPQAVSRDQVDAEAVERERTILADQARASGRPDNIIEKMVEGRLRKYYEDVVLTEQTFVIDGETKVAAALEAAAKDIGAPVAVTGFVRLALGEGVEKEATDFAAEVAAQVGT